MAARMPPSAHSLLRARGVRPTSTQKYLRALEHWLGQAAPHVLIAALNWRTYARRLAPRSVPVYLENVAGPDVLGENSALLGATDAAFAPGELRRQIAAASAAERLGLLVAKIRGLVAQILGFSSPARVDPRSGFFELGIDSLSALEARHRLEVALGQDLPATALMDFATSEALAKHLHDEVLGYAQPKRQRLSTNTAKVAGDGREGQT